MSHVLFIFEILKAFTLRVAFFDNFILNEIFEHIFPSLKLRLFQCNNELFFNCLNFRSHKVSFKLNKLLNDLANLEKEQFIFEEYVDFFIEIIFTLHYFADNYKDNVEVIRIQSVVN